MYHRLISLSNPVVQVRSIITTELLFLKGTVIELPVQLSLSLLAALYQQNKAYSSSFTVCTVSVVANLLFLSCSKCLYQCHYRGAVLRYNVCVRVTKVELFCSILALSVSLYWSCYAVYFLYQCHYSGNVLQFIVCINKLYVVELFCSIVCPNVTIIYCRCSAVYFLHQCHCSIMQC
jgi:hypothetical protein